MPDEKLRELGELLRAQRESLGLTIKDVEQETKIRSVYLMAIESGNDNISPGKAYFRVFLKSYADFLGLNGLEFSKRYQEITEAKAGEREKGKKVEQPDTRKTVAAEDRASRTRRKSETKRAKRRKRSAKITSTLLVIAIILLAAWGIWKGLDYLRSQKELGENTGSEHNNVPEEPPVTGEEEPIPPEQPVKVVRTDTSAEVSVFETNKSPMEIVLETLSGSDVSCWIKAEADGEVVLEKTMGSAEKIELSADKELRVRAGRPWVLTITVNGEDLGVGGSFGPVKDLVFKYNKDL